MQKKCDFVGTPKTEAAWCFPQNRSHMRKRDAWGLSASTPARGPGAARPARGTGQEAQSEPPHLPWSSENSYGSNISSVAARNK